MNVGLMMIFARHGLGGVPYDEAEASLRLFATEVLPVLKSWQPLATAHAAE
jgi:hypothetical protein